MFAKFNKASKDTFRLTEVPNPRNGKIGYDVTRRVEIGEEPIRLKYFEEAFTSKEVMVRVFRYTDNLTLAHRAWQKICQSTNRFADSRTF